jgi:putative transcriptional regulator
MPTHHPSEATHVEVCTTCRATVRGLEALGGEMVAVLPRTSLSEDALPRAMAGIERPSPPGEPARPVQQRIPFGRELWLGPGMGVRKAKLAGGLLYQLRLGAGQQTFPHGHHGMECTTVLKGAFHDGFETYAAGDFAEADEGLEHLPHVSPDSECICLIASEKPLRALSLVGRFFQTVARV